jgi:NAD(P)-dependent dehydrogenase (short-subunit alcohol dehydrogenase family)
MDTGLKGKVAVVTGASQGIGAAIAAALRAEGCKLALLARNLERLNGVKRDIAGGKPDEILALACDVQSRKQVEAAFAKIIDHFGGVDVLVNNAGGNNNAGNQPPRLAFDALSDEDWIDTFDLNVLSAVRATRCVLPSMLAKGWGRIINITSESAVQPDPFMPDYNAAKAALNAFAKTLSQNHAAQGVLVNSVAVAFTETPALAGFVERQTKEHGISYDEAVAKMVTEFRPHVAVKRPGKPAEIAAAVVFLASEQASFINGSILRADGGSVATV